MDEWLHNREDSIYHLYPELNAVFDTAKFYYYAINWDKYICKNNRVTRIIESKVYLKSFRVVPEEKHINFEVLLSFEDTMKANYSVLSSNVDNTDSSGNIYPYLHDFVLDSMDRILFATSQRGCRNFMSKSIADRKKNYEVVDKSFIEYLFTYNTIEFYKLNQTSLNPWFREQLLMRGILKE